MTQEKNLAKVPSPRETWNASALRYGFPLAHDKDGQDEERIVLKRYGTKKQRLSDDFKRVMVTLDNPTYVGILRELIRHG